MRKNRRTWLIVSALLLTLAATIDLYLKDSSSDDGGIEVITTAAARHPVAQIKPISSSPVPISLLPTRFLQDTTQDIFQPKIKVVEVAKEISAPPPPPPVIIVPVLPPPTPAAPPIPFTYIGKYMEDGVLVVFLSYGGKNLIVKVGDIIQQTYKVEDIRPPLMTVTYLPMAMKQSVQIGELQ